ncbi:histidine kinase dimerization/phospho-acceptor domain-containing protein [Porphyrobacter sp. YT40]|uniref:histidine kinase dimerization/phospho-acceptor domain-containing protein n=1 Tax=Porphyrobacter sp. YT40 TaxID=2547601 RepID=UPI001142FBC8|nr:histidine kinase dimerization/phospho-acceptor domain-containing protein [Porphyrobacter sp. YT40]QDH35342.1 sensor histidine kinase [Porphyrobacter sp. YT40]
MFFDDRLATVLRQRAMGEGSLRTQYRQLLDLLGRRRVHAPGDDHSLLAAAWLRMDALAEVIPAEARARMIREPGWRFQSPDLASHLADHEPEVAAAALTRADLASEDWAALIPRLPVRARGFLRLRRDLPVDVEALLARLGVHDRGLPAPAPVAGDDSARGSSEAVPQLTPAPPPPPAQPIPLHRAPASRRDRDESGRTEISALVERIAQFRRSRGDNPTELEQSPRLPLGELTQRPDRTLSSFAFAADTAGRINWAVSEAAPMVVGTRLFGADDAIARAFARRQPVIGGAVSLAGAPAITGEWSLDAEPHFSADGHFTGYLGRLRRVPDPSSRTLGPEAREADRIRQLLHELRTPVTAVQGYAEVIQQQLFGPAPHEYRALAAAIAADAARILSGFEELDRLARLETGATRIEPGETDLAALVLRTTAQLDPVLAPQGAGLDPAFGPEAALMTGLDPEDAEALVWRVLASLGAACGAGERISVTLGSLTGPAGQALARLACQLPAKLAAADNLFAATTRSAEGTINAGLFGTGFALRLARAEARAAGGGLSRDGTDLILTLPLLRETIISADTAEA